MPVVERIELIYLKNSGLSNRLTNQPKILGKHNNLHMAAMHAKKWLSSGMGKRIFTSLVLNVQLYATKYYTFCFQLCTNGITMRAKFKDGIECFR